MASPVDVNELFLKCMTESLTKKIILLNSIYFWERRLAWYTASLGRWRSWVQLPSFP